MDTVRTLRAASCGALLLSTSLSCSNAAPPNGQHEGPGAPSEAVAPMGPKILGFQSNSDGLPTSGTWREHPCLHDLDGDGLADLIASNREENGLNVWKSNPGAPWEPKLEGIDDTLMYGGSDCADLDGDGKVDLVFASHKLGLRYLMNQGDMKWMENSSVPKDTFLSLDVALGNLNGDSHPDAASIAQFVERGKGALGIFIGRGDGSFDLAPEYRNNSLPSRFGVQVELQDITGDGLDDIFLTAEKGCLLLVPSVSENGELTLEDRSEGLPLPPKKIGNALRSFIPIDVDGDGDFEVAFAGLVDNSIELEERDTLGVRRWNSEDSRWEKLDTGLPNGKAYTDVLTADFNGDTFSDLVVIGSGLGAVIYLGDGEGHFSSAGMLDGTLAGGRGAVGDIDGDGMPDVAVICGASKARPDAGAVRTFLNRKSAWE